MSLYWNEACVLGGHCISLTVSSHNMENCIRHTNTKCNGFIIRNELNKNEKRCIDDNDDEWQKNACMA